LYDCQIPGHWDLIFDEAKRDKLMSFEEPKEERENIEEKPERSPEEVRWIRSTEQGPPAYPRRPLPHIGWTPYMTYTIIGVTIFVYLLQLGSTLFFGVDFPAIYGMKNNQMIVQGQYWRLVTPVFLHSNMLGTYSSTFQITAVLHIVFNMYALNRFGPALERYYGQWRFLILYMISGFAGVVFSFAFAKYNSLGASTAIFGLLAGQGVLAFQNRELFGARARMVVTSIINLTVIYLLFGLMPGIDNWGHMGGLVGGLLVAWFGGPIYALGSPGFKNERTTAEFIRAALIAVALFALLAFGLVGIELGMFTSFAVR
jgi:rhomboid protease GluP